MNSKTKYIIMPIGVCLACIFLTGYYLYRNYQISLDTKKDLLISYMTNEKKKIDIVCP